MKKIVLSIIMTVVALSMGAANTADTTATFIRPMAVTIAESPSGVKVGVVDSDTVSTVFECNAGENSTRRTSQQYTVISVGHNWSLIVSGLTLGFVTTPGCGEGAVEGGKSLELGILNALGIRRELSSKAGISLGIGFDWRNYRSTKGLLYVPDGGSIRVSHIPAGTDYRFSRLKVFSVQFPLLFSVGFDSPLAGVKPSLSVGPVFCWNPHGSVKSSWREEDGTVSTFTSNSIGQRKFTIDLYAKASLGVVGLYLRYSPYKTLPGATAPDFRPLSAGMTLLF